jgi:hypothetical protein
MKIGKQLVLAIAFATASAAPVFAHPDHDMVEPENPRQVALTSADHIVDRLIERGAVDASWGTVQPSDALLRQRNGANEWVVTFRNDAMANPDQRVLYVMLSYSGVYLAANYTGD